MVAHGILLKTHASFSWSVQLVVSPDALRCVLTFSWTTQLVLPLDSAPNAPNSKCALLPLVRADGGVPDSVLDAGSVKLVVFRILFQMRAPLHGSYNYMRAPFGGVPDSVSTVQLVTNADSFLWAIKLMVSHIVFRPCGWQHMRLIILIVSLDSVSPAQLVMNAYSFFHGDINWWRPGFDRFNGQWCCPEFCFDRAYASSQCQSCFRFSFVRATNDCVVRPRNWSSKMRTRFHSWCVADSVSTAQFNW